MPELPEVQTTVTGLNRTIVGLAISDVWTDYNSPHFKGSDTIKDPLYFEHFKEKVLGKRIISVTRRAKNILIHLESGSTILIHMKMTGHIIIGRYVFDEKKKKDPWMPAHDERKALHDPFNRFIHFVITFSNKKQLVLSDMRKFGKVTLMHDISEHLKNLGPEPLETDFTYALFKERLSRKPVGKIKTVLMDQSIISGVGNIYSDEALWRAGIHPEQRTQDIPEMLLKKLYTATLQVLRKGIDFGGDSMSDYRNIDGERGKFQEEHQAYRKTGKPCGQKIKGKICTGTILRKVVGGRSAHFCSIHQKLQKN
ncbi:MAG TPA: bifunctional DNA-formamidopyrimidine glycosylase/DNA-(apurinic or apyrimidinic site) lyase [Candidatus Paceibacterota bacterium]|jgi:formamidopyrimidine-DNA glycosylase|nr:bifunctional DNA-formamidopyrimidine glycosylase/DNA-(apurinic or apyrimidinic site) lyase [Candidatus Paceibacterota bacterium]